MGLLQKIYNAIKNFKTPLWLKLILAELQKVIVGILIQVGQEALGKLEDQILKVNAMHISNEDKLKKVYDYCINTLGIDAREHLLRLLIESTIARLKKKNVI